MTKQTVMVIEDNHLNRKLFGDLLQVHGYETVMLDTPLTAVETAVRYMPDLILMDIQLPEISGLDLLPMLRAEPAIAHIPVVAVTAFAMKGDEENILSRGCCAYLAKPISVATFISTVRRYILPPGSGSTATAVG